MPPELVLAGQDPSQPAIDASSGAPVTIEELLRRRGLMSYNGNMRFSPLEMSGSGAGDTTAGMAGSGNGVATAANGANLSMGDVAGVVGSEQDIPDDMRRTFEGIAGNTQSEAEADQWIETLAALGAGGAGMTALWYLWKRRNGLGTSGPSSGGNLPAAAVPPTAPNGGAGGSSTVNNSLRNDPGTAGALPDNSIVDGEFSEVRPEQIGARQPIITSEMPQGAPANDNTVAGAIAARRGAGVDRRAQASDVAARAAAGQPNDVGTLRMGEDPNMYPEEVVRNGNALADEIIAARLRGQASRRSRIAGSPTAPINRYRQNEPISNQRPGLVNEMIGLQMRNGAQYAQPNMLEEGASGTVDTSQPYPRPLPEGVRTPPTPRGNEGPQQYPSNRSRFFEHIEQMSPVELQQARQRFEEIRDGATLPRDRAYYNEVLEQINRVIQRVVPRALP